MSLFKRLITPDRQQTQLAYRIKFWPWHELSAAGRELVAYRKQRWYHKAELALFVTDDMNCIILHERLYKIVWAYNNMPTEQEWKACKNDRLISVELRCSAAIDTFAVAILSFGLPSERLKAAAKGELPAGMDYETSQLDSGERRRHSDFVPLSKD